MSVLPTAGQGRAVRNHGAMSVGIRRSRRAQRVGRGSAHYYAGWHHVQDAQGATGLTRGVGVVFVADGGGVLLGEEAAGPADKCPFGRTRQDPFRWALGKTEREGGISNVWNSNDTAFGDFVSIADRLSLPQRSGEVEFGAIVTDWNTFGAGQYGIVKTRDARGAASGRLGALCASCLVFFGRFDNATLPACTDS